MRMLASRTGTKKNLARMRAHDWGILVSATGVWRTEGFKRWWAENGQWTERDNPAPFNAERYERFLRWVAKQPIQPECIVLPDIVAGGLKSLELSRRWYRLLRRRKAFRDATLMLVVQDGMEPKHVRRLIGAKCHVFIGGSTEWKLAEPRKWSAFAHSRGALCHMGRVNSKRRIRICIDAGIDSADGTSGTIFGDTIRPLDLATRQLSIEGYLARKAA